MVRSMKSFRCEVDRWSDNSSLTQSKQILPMKFPSSIKEYEFGPNTRYIYVGIRRIPFSAPEQGVWGNELAQDMAFRIQVMDTIAALMTAAFGLIAALAWNEAIKWAVDQVFTSSPGVGLFIYAILVTILAVVAVLLIGRSIAKLKGKVAPEKK